VTGVIASAGALVFHHGSVCTKEIRMANVDLDTLRKDMTQMHKELRSITENLKGAASQRTEQGLDSMREGMGQARGRALDAAHAVESQIDQRPFSSILLTFVIGLIAGLLMQSRR